MFVDQVVESAAVPTVVEALAKLPLSEEDSQDLIIEAFVGTYSGPILPMLLRSAISNAALPPWLRVRKVLKTHPPDRLRATAAVLACSPPFWPVCYACL